eukprot:snap_masked-scaffold_3-processed-gene-1.17-mRNA-1 protein AED:1.00 eAED:1.00 QI:0/-1/0/0/-1/1/1/0/86
MKEVDKFKELVKDKLVPRACVLEQEKKTVRFLELLNKNIDNVTKEKIPKIYFGSDGSKLQSEEDVYSPVSNKETTRIFIGLSTAEK